VRGTASSGSVNGSEDGDLLKYPSILFRLIRATGK